MATLKKTDTSFENTFRSFSKATKEYTEGLGESIEKLKDKVDSYSAAVARGEKIDTVARLKAEKSYQAALAVKAESEENDLKKLNKFHRMLAFGERKWDRIQKKKWMGVDLKDRRQFVDTGVGKMLLKMGNSWEKFTNTKLYKVASSTYERLKGHAESIFDEILGPAKQVFDIAKTSIQGIYKGSKGFLTLLFPFLKKLGGMFDKKKDDPVKDKLSEKLSKIYEQAGEISKLLSENPTDKKLLKELSDLQKKAARVSALIEKPTEKELTDKLKGIYDESGKISKQLAESGPDKALLDKLTELNTEAKDIRDQLKAKPSSADTKLLQEISEELKGQTTVLEHSLEQTQKEKLRQQLQGGDKKSGGFFSSLLDGFTGLFSNIGKGFMGVLSGILGGGALLSVFMSALGIIGSAFLGFAAGKKIQEKWGKEIGEFVDKTADVIDPRRTGTRQADDMAEKTAKTYKDLGEMNKQLIAQGKAPVPTVKGRYEAQKGNIQYAAKEIGVREGTLTKMLGVESGYDPNAVPIDKKTGKPLSSARGTGQFLIKTWDDLMKANPRDVAKYGITKEGRTTDPLQQAIMTAMLIRENERAIKKKSGKSATDEELYMAHFAGSPDASKFAAAGDEAYGADVTPASAKSNPWIFYKDPKNRKNPRTIGEIKKLFSSKLSQFTPDAMSGASTVALSKQEAIAPAAAAGAQVVAATEKELEQKKIANQKEIAALLKEERKEPDGPRQVVNMVQTGGSGEQPTRGREVPVFQIPSGFLILASTQ